MNRSSSISGRGPLPITIVLVDDHTMMREGTRRLLEEDPDLKVVGEAEDGADALPLCRQLRPQVIVLDIAMKHINGFSVAQELLQEHASAQSPAILVLTAMIRWPMCKRCCAWAYADTGSKAHAVARFARQCMTSARANAVWHLR